MQYLNWFYDVMHFMEYYLKELILNLDAKAKYGDDTVHSFVFPAHSA